MSIWKTYGLAILLLIGTGQTTVLADETSKRQAVEQLFVLTARQQKIDESVSTVLAMQGAIQVVHILDIIGIKDRLGLASASAIDTVDQHAVLVPEFIDV
jgi:hypothetical protein